MPATRNAGVRSTARFRFPSLLKADLEVSRARCPRERNDVADVVDSGNEHQQSFKPETKPGMRHGPEPAQINIPVILLFAEIVLFQVRLQHVKTFFALAAANDFPNTGNQHIHSRYRFTVIILPHVEGFDIGGVVVNGDGTLEVSLCQVALVF